MQKAPLPAVYAMLVVSMFFFGISFVWVKEALDHYSPVALIFIRLSLAVLLMIPLSKIFKLQEKIDRADWPAFALLAFFEPFCYFIAESYGLRYVSPTVASLMIATIPLVAPFFCFFLLKEKFGVSNGLGLIVSFFGLFLALGGQGFDLSGSFQGVLLLSGAVVSACLYSIYGRRLLAKYRPFTVVKVQSLLGAFYFLPFFLYFDAPQVLSVLPPAHVLFNILSLVVFCTILAFLFYTQALARIGVIKTHVFSNLIPVFAALGSYFLLGEQFDLQKIMGMAFVLAGVTLTQIEFRKPQLEKTIEFAEAVAEECVARVEGAQTTQADVI